MHRALGIIRDEHRSIAAVLHGMHYFAQQAWLGKPAAHPRVFRAMLYYLDTFCERMHHPKEDRYLFDALRRHGAESQAVIGELEAEHSRGAEALRRLEQLLLRYEEGGEAEFAAFAGAVERFQKDYWEHMRKEEDEVFPLAEDLLSDAEWREIDSVFELNRDPLVSARDVLDFQKLFTHVVSIAPPPIGVGPEA